LTHSHGQLASCDMDLPHGGCRNVRVVAWGSPPGQPASPWPMFARAVLGPVPDDRQCAPFLGRRRALRGASAPRGIRGAGCGKKGCPEYFFLDGDDVGLLALCEVARYWKIFRRRRVFCPWLAEQADAGDASLRPPDPRLLAVAAIPAGSRGCGQWQVGDVETTRDGKGSPLGNGGGFLHRHYYRVEKGRGGGRGGGFACRRAGHECINIVRCLSRQDGVARVSVHLLSVPCKYSEQFRQLLELQPNNIVAKRNLEAALSKMNLPK